jgi:hypothetical protein
MIRDNQLREGLCTPKNHMAAFLSPHLKTCSF